MIIFILLSIALPFSCGLNGQLISNFTVNLVKTPHVVVLGCSADGLLQTAKSLAEWNQVMFMVNLTTNYSLRVALTRRVGARTSVVLDCSCPESEDVLLISSERRYFNKTYQWMLWDSANQGVEDILRDVINLGPATQMMYVNRTGDQRYSLFDIHSKGRHLHGPIEVIHFADWEGKLITHADIFELQGIQGRGQFNGFPLRIGTVIDRDNITTDEQVLSFLSSPYKLDGVTTFVKYHHELLSVLQERLNFSAKYRNVRGWAGRLGGKFRLGFLGIVMRNEVEIGTSGAFNRINRFAEFDTIHQSWKFESGFLYRFTTDVNTDGKSGDFLAPFASRVWVVSGAMIVVVIIIWRLVVWLNRGIVDGEREDDGGFLFKTIAAVCQQGLDPVPGSLSSRTIVLTLFVFTLVMYNYYTSSVVGGLLNSSGQGPKTVADIVNSPLKLVFEDIGYYKVLFKDSKSPLVHRMYRTKVLPKRGPNELQVFTTIKKAIPYLRTGEYAFHCEVYDAYPQIARLFDASEICDLRIVEGLLETEVLNWIIPKNSLYTEIFRIIMCRAKEVGIVSRALRIYRIEKPACQSGYTVYPVAFSGVNSAFLLLGGGALAAFMVLGSEILFHRRVSRNRRH